MRRLGPSTTQVFFRAFRLLSRLKIEAETQEKFAQFAKFAVKKNHLMQKLSIILAVTILSCPLISAKNKTQSGRTEANTPEEQLAGFTDHETELIAQVARYHRKSAPKSKHDEWEVLSEPDKARVTTLAAILRIAIGLDRGDRTVVHSVEAEVSKSTIVIKAHTRPGVDADLEIYSARARAALFAEVTGRTIEVLVEPVGDLGRSHPSDQ